MKQVSYECQQCGYELTKKKDNVYLCKACNTIYNLEQLKNLNTNYTDLISKVETGVVRLSVPTKDRNGWVRGTGFFVENNYIVTNAHVIEHNPNDITCITSNDNGRKQQIFPASTVYYSLPDDVAILKPCSGKLPEDSHIFEISNKEAKMGEQVYTIGNPLHYDFTCSDGIVAKPNYERRDKTEVGCIFDALQTTITFNGGNSGGPVFNTDGVVLGMATYSETEIVPKECQIKTPEGIVPTTIVSREAIKGFGMCVKARAINLFIENAKSAEKNNK